MIKTFEEKQRERLMEMRDRLATEINRMREAVQEEAAPPGEHARNSSSESIDKEILLETAEEHIRRAVIAAIRRIDQNRYGTCPACGGKISRIRLQAIPYAERCIKCEQRGRL
jgi:DnaK suppressor protein